MKKIRIAIMADEFDRRPERTLFWRHVIEALVASPQFDVTLIHSQPMPDEPLYRRAREVLIQPLKLPWGGHFAAFIRYCLTTDDRFDLVHSFTARLYPCFWLFPAKRRVAMAHGGGERLAPGSWTVPRFVFVAVLRLFHRYVDARIAVSEYANRESIYAYHVPPEKVVTIYPHVDATFAALPSVETAAKILAEDYGLKAGSYFMYVGRARTHKNIGNLVEAYLRYRERNPDATELLAIGGDTRELYERTFGPVRPSPFAGDIRFIGYVPNDHMAALYSGACALAFVTLNEGFGVPIVEAMACGTPVITSSATAMPEVAGEAALIVDPRSPDALAEAFRLISTDDALRAELIRRGLQRSEFFTWDRALAETVALFSRVVGTMPLVYNPIAPPAPETYVNAGLKVPLLEAIDRVSILMLKVERLSEPAARASAEHALVFYRKVLDSYREEGVDVQEEWIAQMREVNARLWDVEAQIRLARKNNLSAEEVGKIAVQLRDGNNARDKVKSAIDARIDIDCYAVPPATPPGVDTSLKLPLHEAIDRLSILMLKFERLPRDTGTPALEKEHAFYQRVIDSYRTGNGIDADETWIAGMKEINGRIWDIEGAIRRGSEGELGLAEVGRRTLQLREIDKERLGWRNKIADAVGVGYHEVKEKVA